MRFMLIQWIEDPPTWDVLSTDKIINGKCEIGGVCDVQYEEKSSPAKILDIGKYVYSVHCDKIDACCDN